MPVKVIKYRCQFKCGKWAMHTIKDALNHEEYCYKNPANKTCATCNNEVYDNNDDYIYRGCKLTLFNDWIEQNDNLLLIRNSTKGHYKPLFNCTGYNLSVINNKECSKFLEEVFNRMENKRIEQEKSNNISSFLDFS